MEDNIKADKLRLEYEVFLVALDKLVNEGLITGVNFNRGGGKILIAITKNIKMTRYGIEYVESKLDINHTLTGEEKIKKILKDGAAWGWDQLKDIAARTLVEISKQ